MIFSRIKIAWTPTQTALQSNLSSVKVNNKNVGVISAQYLDQSVSLCDQDFAYFQFILEHLNMCLSLVSNRLTS